MSNDASPKSSARPLFAGLLVMLALMGSGTGIAIFQLKEMAATLDNVVRDDELARTTVNTMLSVTRERALIMTEVFGMNDVFDRDERLLEIDQLAGPFSIALQQQASLSVTPDGKAILAQQRQLIARLVEQFSQVSSLARRGQLEAAERIFRGVIVPTQSQMLNTLMQWTELHSARHSQLVREAQNRQEQALSMIFSVAAGSVLVGMLVAWVVYRWNRRLIGRFLANEIRLREALAQSAFRQRALDTHSIISVTDATGTIIHANNKFCAVSGYSQAELIGQNHRIVKSDFHAPDFYQAIWETISAGKIWTGEIRNRSKNGDDYWVQTTIVPMLDDDKLPIRYISVRTEITRLKAMEASILKANDILTGKVLDRTRELEIAKHQLESELADRVRTQDALQQSYDELKSLHRQLQEAQDYLMQSEKLAAVGQLAAGMAHEINNPIGFIASNLATLGRYQDTLGKVLERYIEHESDMPEAVRNSAIAYRKQADLDFLLEDTRDLLAESRSGVERVRNIVRDLRGFARIDSDGQLQEVDINQCLDTTLNLFAERLAKNVVVDRELGQSAFVACNPADLNQVFVNLLNNAQQALQEKGGAIKVRSGHEDGQAWVEITDTGVGIAESVLPQIFDPFFTTRPIGQGAGLGLSTAYGIVQKNDGLITVSSQTDVGTVFRVTLPCVPVPSCTVQEVEYTPRPVESVEPING